jgi:glycosyltransferase involved in cell wall biosynthesis
MQAMACGLPCVTTTAGAITEAIEDRVSGIVIAPRDTQALGAAIEALAGDLELARRLGQSARMRATEQFGRDRMVDRMLGLFEQVARGARKGPG